MITQHIGNRLCRIWFSSMRITHIRTLDWPLYVLFRYRNRPVMSGPGLYDPTSIMNHEVLSQCQREGWIKLAFYLLAFFYYLYGWVILGQSVAVERHIELKLKVGTSCLSQLIGRNVKFLAVQGMYVHTQWFNLLIDGSRSA